MNILLYSGFYKRRNSTKQPSGGTAFTVALKENTSMMRPHFLIHTVDWSWNYAQWGPRYYYVTDIVSESNNLFRVECELDTLATFRADIGAYSTLISRASADQNYNVIDSIYPAKAIPITKRAQISNPGIFTTNRANGCYLVGTIGGSGMHFYIFTPGAFALFCIQLFPRFSAQTIAQWIETQISTAPVGGLSTILQNIVLLKWLPISYSSVSSLLTSVSEVTVGNFSVSATAGELAGSTTIQLLGTSATFPNRDDNGARGKWLYTAPFANYSVYIPPFGMINLDPTYVPGASREISIDLMAEIISGNITMRLYYALGSGGIKMVGVYNANIAQDLRAGGATGNFGGVAGGLIGAAASYALDDAAGVLTSIASAARSATPQTSQIGGGVSGPSPDLSANWYAYATYFDPIDENRAELGRPLAEIKQISSLGGFVQTAAAKLAIPGHAEEMVEVNDMLNSGIFYE